ncbi:long-chain fatty acid-CoA ligase [Coemansia thaxteri]|uniref:Long-chain fatty acid-CoA ligase n=1 Tax=Coemansia thaxteri TaxID=2663907 RepID=A0A9W8BDD7_9FUNG|nr:long-chain fatty acid-CoA ligase [Coemansia thaxteri]KAJ2003121.1 long-chain fatty acid-CoA ligase [Coemansia thaxteri]KAJ2470606.1 long-chain fatty acid-CoA ligase [Coemansia sp. RSA 2322]KAJ2483974.1 long-chain fatty acid-CoA ligase [Coemansia sp. RSA 2320]
MAVIYSKAVPQTGSDTETPTRRFHTTADRIVDRARPDITNIYAALIHSQQTNPDSNSLGKRDVLGTVTEEKTVPHKVDGKIENTTKQWSYFKLGEYKWMTYDQVYHYTKNLGAGFVKLGLQPKSRVLIYVPTSREWQLCAFGAFSQSMQVVTAYDTLGESGLLHAMNQAKVDLVFLKADQMPTLARIMDQIETVKHVVYYQDLYGMPKGCEEAIEKVRTKFGVTSMDELHDLGSSNPIELTLPDNQDIALVMYTSGSTGKPKGVLICHQGVMSVAGGIHEFIEPFVELHHDVVLSYLPLSHVLAFFVDIYCIYSGLPIGYGTPRTLTDESVRECKGDIKELRPMVMMGVPQVWNTIRAGMLKQVDKSSWLVRKLFYSAVELKNALRGYNMPHNFMDSIVFKKTREATGGRLKFVITGGAPINRNVQKLMNAALCPMIQGFGLTEASGLVSVQLPNDTSFSNVGAPCPSVEMKLVDVPEAKYFAKNGQGEIWVRGPSIFKGYLDNEELTKETMTEDGWLMTGDIGQWTLQGQLSIIDRKKNIVKLVSGEYIALEALEATYKNSLYIHNICVFADARMTQPCAIVNIDENQIAHMADDIGVQYNNPSEIAANKDFIAAVLADLQLVAKRNSLGKQETLAAIRVDAELWSPENDRLTPAMKLKRTDIRDFNQDKLDDMYTQLNLE